MSEHNLKEVCSEYEELQLAIKEMEEKRDALKPILLEMIPEDTKIDTGIGVFTTSSRKKWKYSEGLTEREEKLKKDKKIEEQTGVAEATAGEPFIVYKAKK